MELEQRLTNLEFKIDLILRKLDEKPDRSELPRPAGRGGGPARRGYSSPKSSFMRSSRSDSSGM